MESSDWQLISLREVPNVTFVGSEKNFQMRKSDTSTIVIDLGKELTATEMECFVREAAAMGHSLEEHVVWILAQGQASGSLGDVSDQSDQLDRSDQSNPTDPNQKGERS